MPPERGLDDGGFGAEYIAHLTTSRRADAAPQQEFFV
jgi:hypothetical protein